MTKTLISISQTPQIKTRIKFLNWVSTQVRATGNWPLWWKFSTTMRSTKRGSKKCYQSTCGTPSIIIFLITSSRKFSGTMCASTQSTTESLLTTHQFYSRRAITWISKWVSKKWEKLGSQNTCNSYMSLIKCRISTSTMNFKALGHLQSEKYMNYKYY